MTRSFIEMQASIPRSQSRKSIHIDKETLLDKPENKQSRQLHGKDRGGAEGEMGKSEVCEEDRLYQFGASVPGRLSLNN